MTCPVCGDALGSEPTQDGYCSLVCRQRAKDRARAEHTRQEAERHHARGWRDALEFVADWIQEHDREMSTAEMAIRLRTIAKDASR